MVNRESTVVPVLSADYPLVEAAGSDSVESIPESGKKRVRIQDNQ
jgi:hypothetical protein